MLQIGLAGQQRTLWGVELCGASVISRFPTIYGRKADKYTDMCGGNVELEAANGTEQMRLASSAEIQMIRIVQEALELSHTLYASLIQRSALEVAMSSVRWSKTGSNSRSGSLIQGDSWRD